MEDKLLKSQILEILEVVQRIATENYEQLIIRNKQLEDSWEQISKLERAVDQSPASVVITDMDGNIEYVNPKFCEVTGYTRKEAIGRNPRFLKTGYQGADFYLELWNTIKSGKEWRGEFHNRKKDGTKFWERASISAVRNLVSNAIKFTEPGGEVRIMGKDLGNELEISVSDSGVGIKEENVSTQGTDNEGGTGLGLLLCKEFVEKNGGKIRVISKPGHGSEFLFTISQNL